MLFAKKIKQILLLVFLVSTLASCDTECYEADQFYSKMYTIKAKPDSSGEANGQSSLAERKIYGVYNDQNGGEIVEWGDTGMVANGDYFVLAISGGWVDNGAFGKEISENKISEMNSCRLCIKLTGDEGGNCFCGPILDNGGLDADKSQIIWETPQPSQRGVDGQENTIKPDCINNASDFNNPSLCECRSPNEDQKKIFFKDGKDKGYFSFFRPAYEKKSTLSNPIEKSRMLNDCAYKMGTGLYIGLIDAAGSDVPPLAYHLASTDVICPITPKLDNGVKRCIDKGGVDRTKVIYRSPDLKIFKKTISDLNDESVYHKSGDKIKLNIYDQFLSDNSGKYKVEFMRGVTSKEGEGLIADIVGSFSHYLFGASYYDEKLKITIKKEGVVEFMYKAILKDKIVRSVISISLSMYISFYGLAFFMGMTDFGKKEVMMRLLKIGLVIMFTNDKAWLMYNTFIVTFFNDGMESLVWAITGIFESNMERSLASIAMQLEGSSMTFDAGRKFIYSDSLIMDLISKPNISRIFALLWIPGKGFFALIYIPVILLLIIYFIYMVLDVALKYLINLLKICIGLALGPVFILFSLFEKTKDMFNNWLAFVASRSLEIVILFTMLHPFLKIIEHSFTDMLTYDICNAKIEAANGLWKFSVSRPGDIGGVNDRSIFDWFQYFLKIAALIFITKSVCDKAGYISGQLISIGGVANADSSSEKGKGEGGFNMATTIAKGAFGLAKTALTNSKISQAGKFAGRLMITNLTKMGRAEIGQSGSINDMVNNAFKAVGIRNRGLRSYMRDREIDNAYNFAAESAKEKGLEGQEKDAYIRKEANKKINMFINQNRNKASLLGIDPENIEKRLNQRLIKEPLKEHIKKEGEKLKNQGIIGKEARIKLEDEAQKWGKENLSFSEGAAERKVAEFFKKTSVQGVLKSASEMTSSQAINYIGNLISTGDIDKAEEFKKIFRENAIEGKIEKYQKGEENKREGGVVGKGFARAGNIFGHVVAKPLAGVIDLGAKGINKVSGRELKTDRYQDMKLSFSKVNLASKIPESLRRRSGRFDNKVARGRDKFFGLLGYAGMDVEKDFRKFDRKLARKLSNPENAEKIKGHNEKNKKTTFASELKAVEGEKIKDRKIFQYEEKDSTTIFVAKLAGNALLFPVNFVRKKYHMYRGGEKEEFERLGRENQLSTLREMAKDETKKINGKLLARYEQNLKVDEKTKVAKTGEEQTAALTRLEKSKEQRDSMEKVALMMKKMEKTVKDQEKAKELNTLESKEKRLEELKRLDSKDEEGKETLFERLSKIEAIAGVSNLKSEFVKKVNERIDHYSKYLEASYELEVLKGALFKSVDEVNMDKNSELFNIFKDVVSNVSNVPKAPVDFISAGDLSASAPASAPASVPASVPDKDHKDDKEGYRKQQQLLEEFYKGEKTITKVEASGKLPKKRLYTIDEEDEEEEL